MGFLDKVKEFVNTDELYDGENDDFGADTYDEQPAARPTRRERESRFSNDSLFVISYINIIP